VLLNPYLAVPAAVWAISQLLKFTLAALRGRIDFRYLYASGGMPSVHSAVVCSLATTALLVDGSSSHLFGFTVIFAAIVMYDSFGVRRSAGEQAAAINMLMESLEKSKVRLSEPNLHLREILGHQPKEVTAGAVLGVVLGLLFNYGRLGAFGFWLQANPQHFELWSYAALVAVLVVGSLVQRLILRSRQPKSQAIRRLTKRIFTAGQAIGWLGAVAVAAEYERASYVAWRFWPLVLGLALISWASLIFLRSYKTVPEALAQEADTERKRKWLKSAKRRK